MVLALSSMSAGWQALFFILAVVCFIVGALFQDRVKRVQMVALGLMLFVIPFAYNAVAAA